jgi:hypothetical protein
MREGMRPYWDEATRHEDKLNPGIADVSFVCYGQHGWLEIKKLKAWPKRKSTIVRCKHFTPEQRNFLRRKGRHGGKAWLFAQIERDYLLFSWRNAGALGTTNASDLVANAAAIWRSKMDWADLSRHLRD